MHMWSKSEMASHVQVICLIGHHDLGSRRLSDLLQLLFNIYIYIYSNLKSIPVERIAACQVSYFRTILYLKIPEMSTVHLSSVVPSTE
jgi:hypothetical protein